MINNTISASSYHVNVSRKGKKKKGYSAETLFIFETQTVQFPIKYPQITFYISSIKQYFKNNIRSYLVNLKTKRKNE